MVLCNKPCLCKYNPHAFTVIPCESSSLIPQLSLSPSACSHSQLRGSPVSSHAEQREKGQGKGREGKAGCQGTVSKESKSDKNKKVQPIRFTSSVDASRLPELWHSVSKQPTELRWTCACACASGTCTVAVTTACASNLRWSWQGSYSSRT